MPGYRVLVRRTMDGEVYVDAADESAAEMEAERLLARGASDVDWLEPSDVVYMVELVLDDDEE